MIRPIASQVALVVKNLSANARDLSDSGQEDPLEKAMAIEYSPVFIPRESHGQRSLAGYNP